MSADLLEAALGGDARALGRVLSRVENGGPEAEELLRRAYPLAGRARVVGVTGPPGVGKSTLTDKLTTHYRAAGLKVGIVAVDPSSPFSGGAILGDRIRMAGHFLDSGVFIRSMATRGHLGGLSAASADVVDLLDAAGYEVILVETIGVGQEDIEVTRLVPLTLLVLTPGLGDEIQAMKGGIMEVGDLYVINKADLPGADRVEAVLQSHLAVAGLEDARPILRTVAATGQGVPELCQRIEAVEAGLTDVERERRRRERSRERVLRIVRERLLRRVKAEVGSEEGLERQAGRVARREIDPYRAAAEILAAAGLE